MTEKKAPDHRGILERVARKAMLDRGLLVDYSPGALAELERISPPQTRDEVDSGSVADLRGLLWCSIDNDDSRDLDQLSAAVPASDGKPETVFVAISDVDSLVPRGGEIDSHAAHNTSTVYTAAKIFPMLPERLSTDLSSLNLGKDRLALVIEMGIGGDGSTVSESIYRARVRSAARLSYGPVAAWLEGSREPPDALRGVPGLEACLRLQDALAARMKAARFSRGALEFESRAGRPGFGGDGVLRFEYSTKDRAMEMIENFMIAANGVMARFLHKRGYPGFCRVVRVPKRWDRIAALAAERGFALPGEADPKALSAFMAAARAADPESYPDLSLSILKLMGQGEYAPQYPDQDGLGHFGLAVKDYAHSTAPNRRYSDLVSHRLVKAALSGGSCPYSAAELDKLAKRCTAGEDLVNKEERQVGKSAAALILEARIGETFGATITGVAEKGTWLKLADYPAEGRLVRGAEGLDVGDRLRARLVAADPERGYLDFELA